MNNQIERLISEAERRIGANLAAAIFRPLPGPYPDPPPIPWTTRLRWRWYAAREWLAVHVLRVDVGGEDEW